MLGECRVGTEQEHLGSHLTYWSEWTNDSEIITGYKYCPLLLAQAVKLYYSPDFEEGIIQSEIIFLKLPLK